MKTLKVNIQHQDFILHPSGVCFWEAHQMLLVADVHLGKTTHFRKHGIAIPKDVVHQNFEKLDTVVHHFNPKKICFLGDLFHSFLNSEWQLFEDWVKQHSTEMLLISGNHDIIPRERYESINFQVEDALILDDFSLTHHPEESEQLFNICGHVHPGVRLKGTGKQSLSLPCFFQTKQQLILPAFGSFTGKYLLKPTKKNRVFVIASDSVIAL